MVLVLPLIGAFVNGVFGKRLGKQAVRMMALSAIGGSFIASVLTFLSLPAAEHGAHAVPKLKWVAWRWLDLNVTGRNIPIDVVFGADAMTATMMLVVTGVGFLIHLYSSEYMKADPGYYRFFAYLNLFIFSMLVLILGDSMPILFVGWEGVGLCSYLLIGFWFTEEKNASAGKKAFIANRIGDFGLLLAMALLAYYSSTLTFDGIKATAGNALLQDVKIWPLGNLPTEEIWHKQFAAGSIWPNWLVDFFLPDKPITAKVSTLVGFSVFLGCAGKSAQIPLYVWLPDAMAGPTPVSALIHAATMVTAGVYLVARMCDVFVLSPAAMAVVAITGALTAVFAASMGFFQRDLKKVLAYSTVSQLGFMFMGVGVGAFTAGFFHVFTHAFFKACLFLGAGSVIHAMHARIHDTDQSQDMWNMGGLRKYMPITHVTYLVSCLSIAGTPLLFAGFWSKDEILWKAYSSEVAGPQGRVPPADLGFVDLLKSPQYMWQWPSWLGPTIYWVGIIGATMTAFYMFRSYFVTFWGEFRGWKIVPGYIDPHPHHADEDLDEAGHGTTDVDHHAPTKKHPHGHVDEPSMAHKSASHDDEHDDHAHDDHRGHEPIVPGEIDGPIPHESPLPMTVPLMILGAMAILAGFLGAEPIHVAPLIHKLEPIFEHATKLVVARDGIDPHGGTMWMMMVPGVAAMVVGSGAAYWAYHLQKGEPEFSFKRSMPGLYNLIYDKWRIDELYDATVIGMVDALADIFTMADKWIVDGVIARLTGMLAQGIGAVLRVFHTGRVQIYAASMVVGLLGMGWFFVQPHAHVVVDDEELRSTGKVVATASPGLGYSYAWSGEGLQPSKSDRVEFVVDQGKTREVVVTVRNVFGREAQAKVTVTRPAARPGPGQQPIMLQPLPQQGALTPPSGDAPPDQKPMKLEGNQVGGLLRGEVGQ
ncbi:MAG: NADH-quinone oxidoreductase subunit L [Polyangiaceae bacterium]|nr:NADH-quinone oxidoreductase subunit L [Polyangiaceae bacterium]